LAGGEEISLRFPRVGRAGNGGPYATHATPEDCLLGHILVKGREGLPLTLYWGGKKGLKREAVLVTEGLRGPALSV